VTTAQLFAEALAAIPVLLRAGALWRGVAGVRGAVQASRAPALLPESPEPAEAHTGPRAPSWAHTDTDNQPDIEEAA
jgi:hypothetical protein